MLKGELMERFAIVVDSSADLTQEQYDAMHIDGFIPLSFSIDGKEYLSYCLLYTSRCV